MAAPVLIDLSNYDAMLVQSTQGRSGTPDGNVFFDTTNGLIEFITLQELPNVDLGSGSEANPLDETLGIKLEAAYAFENQERTTDETLRKFDRWLKGSFKFAGAYDYINSRKPSTQADRDIARGSGWTEFAVDGGIDRIYFGNKGLGVIESLSQPYYQLSAGGVPVDYAKLGQFDEAVQVFGDTGNTPSDTGAGDFDTRNYEAVSIRTFQFNYDRKTTVDDLGIAELGPYSTGFAVTETPHLTSGNYTLADVYGGAQIAPWTNMGLEELDTPQTETGFNEADGDFTWVVNNTTPGTLDEVVAFLDALAQTDDDINDHGTNVTNGKRVGVWYSYDAQGRIVTDAPFASEGLFLEEIPVADQQRVVFTDDAGGTKTYPFQVGVEALVGAVAKADVLAWYHSFFAAAYNSAGAVTVEDSGSVEVKGLASAADANYKILYEFDYDGDTVGGGSGTDKDAVFLCEGDGGATQAKTLYTLTRSTTIAFTCAPPAESNV